MKFPEEKSFPRGGRRLLPTTETVQKSERRRPPNKPPQNRQKNINVHNWVEDVKEAVEPNQNISKPRGKKPKQKGAKISLITYQTIREGMVCLGCVADIKEFELKINLPGSLVGFVPVTYISDIYTSTLQNEMKNEKKEFPKLNEIFKVGQFVVTYVVSVLPRHATHKVTLSLLPQSVHVNVLRGHIEGMVLSCAVKSVEDHCYEMDVGIDGVIAVLKYEESKQYETIWNNGQHLGMGQVIRCLVMNRKGSDSAPILDLSADPKKVLKAQVIHEPTHSLPGMLVKSTVEEVVESGLVVKLANGDVGHIHRTHLQSPWTELNSIEKGAEVLGRILYIKPKNNIVYLTYKNIGTPKCTYPFKDIGIGSIVENVKVKGVCDKCVELDLKGYRGLVSHEQTDIKFSAYSKKKITKDLEDHYSKESIHSCRVLDYDYMLQTFACSLKSSMLKQRTSKEDDCKIGDVVTCCVEIITRKRIEVSVNDLDGFIDQSHMAEGVLKNDPTGQEIKARVLAVTDGTIKLTMKPGMVHSKKRLLTDYQMTKTAKRRTYLGVVTRASLAGCVVEFYNNVEGWIPERLLKGNNPYDLSGQLVECSIMKVNPLKPSMLLSLISVEKEMRKCVLGTNKEDLDVNGIAVKTKSAEKSGKVKDTIKRTCLEVGCLYLVTVHEVTDTGLIVFAEDSKIKGYIPTQQLSDHVHMSRLLLLLYQKGDVLQACCIRVSKKPLFSLSPTIQKYFQTLQPNQNQTKITSTYFPTIIQAIQNSGLVLKRPDNQATLYINKKDICDGAVNHVPTLGVKVYQTLMARLRPTPSTKLSVVWNRDMEYGVTLLKEYLMNTRRIQKKIMKHMANFDPGHEVEGAVVSITEIGAVLEITKEVSAVVMPFHYQGMKLELGKRLRGRVLFVDFINNCVEVTLRKDLFLKTDSQDPTNENSGIKPGMTLDGSLIVLKPDLQVVHVEYRDQRHLCYVPTRWHINDLAPTPAFTQLGQRCQVHVVRVDDGLIMGVPAKLHDASTKILEKCKEGTEMNSVMVQEGERDSTSFEAITIGKDVPTQKNKKMKNSLSDECTLREGSDVVLTDKSKFAVSNGSPGDSNSLHENKKMSQARKKKSVFEDTQDFCENVLDINSGNSNIINTDVVVQCSESIIGKKRKSNRKSENGEVEYNICDDAFHERIEGAEFVKGKNSKRKRNKIDVDNDLVCVFEGKNLISKKTSKNNFQTSLTGNKNGKSQETLNSEVKKDRAADKQSKNASTDSESLSKKSSDFAGNLRKKEKGGNDNRKHGLCDVDLMREHIRERKLKRAKKEADNSNLPCLNANVGFVWDPTPEQLPAVSMFKTVVESSDDEDEILQEVNKKKKHRLSVAEKRNQAREEEERLRKIELRLMDAENNPESADDFDRLVLSAPNNSQNWIKYMAFHLQATEIEKARSVGERALKAVSFREEQEKFNIWMAMLNLENLYGSKESFDKTLKEAVQLNDSYKVYMQVLQMYAESDKFQDMQQLVQMVTKKFKLNKETWMRAGSAYMKSGHLDEARKLMQRALTSLEKKDHVEVITKFARLENEFGEKERSETLMEHTLSSYPKRVDVWCSYVDMLIKSDKLDLARQVLERAVVQTLPVGKMKTLYKKFVQFEQTHGTPEGVARVRKMATDYVESAVGSSSV